MILEHILPGEGKGWVGERKYFLSQIFREKLIIRNKK
jgi:hypothetical protein